MLGISMKKLNPLSGIVVREMVGIDFSSSYLKLAHVKGYPNNKKELVNVLSKNIAGLSDDDVSKSIKDSFGELNAKMPDIVSTIPPNLTITKNIEIPSTNPQEIKEIINLQAGRHTPYAREEIIIDYIEIGTYRHSYTKILLIIAANNIIKRNIEILDKAGLRLEKVLFSAEGLGWYVSKILKLENTNFPVNVIHVDESFTDFTVVFKNKTIFVRSIPIGAQHLSSQEEKNQIRFVEEIKRSLEAYQSENVEKNPGNFVLMGAIKGLKDIEISLNDVLRLPLKTISYFGNFPHAETVSKTVSSVSNLSFFNVIVPLFASEEMKVNLAPEEMKLRKAFEERGKDLIKTGISTLTFFVLVFSILISNIYFKSAYLRKLDAEYQTVNKEAQKLEGDFTKISLIKNYLSKRGYSLDVLAELYTVIPQDLELADIRFDGQGKFSIKGTAESMSTVFSFVDNMEKSKYFKDVKTRYTTKRKDGLKDVADFEIVSSLEGEGSQ